MRGPAKRRPVPPLLAALGIAATLAGCAPTPGPSTATAAAPVAEPAGAPTSPRPADAFCSRIAGLCGKAFEGRVVVDEPPSPGDAFSGKRLVMHVRECRPGAWKIPFHVGDDRSRTWLLTRTPAGLRLKHDHRHEDGAPDATTMYGGETTTPGTAARQEFPVDAESIATFEREGLKASVTNVWAMEIEPGRRFVYELARPGGRLFRVEFDLSKPVEPPPAPWGHD